MAANPISSMAHVESSGTEGPIDTLHLPSLCREAAKSTAAGASIVMSSTLLVSSCVPANVPPRYGGVKIRMSQDVMWPVVLVETEKKSKLLFAGVAVMEPSENE